jgi:gag-polypeptide of LTR copia-type
MNEMYLGLGRAQTPIIFIWQVAHHHPLRFSFYFCFSSFGWPHYQAKGTKPDWKRKKNISAEYLFVFLPFQLINPSHMLRIKKGFMILFYWRSSNLASTRQKVHAVEASCLGSFWETRSTPTSLRWLMKAHTTTIQKKCLMLEKKCDESNEVSCLMLVSMAPDHQKRFENWPAYNMIGELKNMFQEQACVERYRVVMELFECKMTEGASVSAHVQKLMDLMEQLGKLGSTMDLQLSTNLILHSLPLSFSYELKYGRSLYAIKWVAFCSLYGWDIYQTST